jgi:hypothetical protein
MRKILDSEIIENIKTSKNMRDLILKMNACVSGAAYKILKKRISELNLDTNHWNLYKKSLPKIGRKKEIPLEMILVENSSYNSSHVKDKLFKYNLLVNECNICGQLPEWNGLPLVLQLDHINGVSNDNRIENLRILCPHCHTQTETYGSKRFKLPDTLCPNCGMKMSAKSKRCQKCYGKDCSRATKIIWPEIYNLLEMVKASSYYKIAKDLGVNDNTVRKHISIYFKHQNQKINLKTFELTEITLEQIGVVETPS